MSPKFKKPTHLAVVWWDDAHFESGEVDPNKASKAYDKVSCGLLIQDDDKGIRVAQDWNHEHGTAEAVTFVPKAMIVRVRRIKLPEAPKRN